MHELSLTQSVFRGGFQRIENQTMHGHTCVPQFGFTGDSESGLVADYSFVERWHGDYRNHFVLLGATGHEGSMHYGPELD